MRIFYQTFKTQISGLLASLDQRAVSTGLLFLASIGGCRSAPAPSVTAPRPTTALSSPSAADTVRWPIDNLQNVGGHPATVLGAPKVVNDAKGTAVSFDGVDDGLVLPVVPFAGMKAFTLEVLFRPDSAGPVEQRFFHTEDADAHRMLMETRLTPDGKWALDTFLLAGTSRLALLDTTKLHPADQWHWVALRYDGTTMSHFVNGVQELSGPVTFPPMASTGQMSLGVRLNRVSWFKGQIKEVRITPRALAESELRK